MVRARVVLPLGWMYSTPATVQGNPQNQVECINKHSKNFKQSLSQPRAVSCHTYSWP